MSGGAGWAAKGTGGSGNVPAAAQEGLELTELLVGAGAWQPPGDEVYI